MWMLGPMTKKEAQALHYPQFSIVRVDDEWYIKGTPHQMSAHREAIQQAVGRQLAISGLSF